MKKESPFDILGIKESDTREDIKSKYRKLVRETHPDVSKKSGKEFQKIHEAYKEIQNLIIWDKPVSWDKKPTNGKPFLDMGQAGECFLCNKRFCQCKERRPGGILYLDPNGNPYYKDEDYISSGLN